MDQQHWKQVNRIVDTALDLEHAERLTYIEQACKGDQQLKENVTELLKSIEQSSTEGFLEGPESYPVHLISDFSNPPDSDARESPLIGKTIGNYKILELIGHGGMGSVFQTERTDQAYDKKVALKLLRRGMNTPSNVARFQHERNILANLDHPNIARLLDGGVTDDGLPYLVMEYVDGTPLYEYCNNHQLSIEERLDLFNSICQAVQHAHKNAIIHRDLKPSNILVTEDETIKILDFGIAKMMDPDTPGKDIFQTRTGARMLTLGYAAPEQIENDPITTATDVYTLGILLYELLAGIHPFDLDSKNLSEIEDVIRNEVPTKPSEKIASLSPDKEKLIAKFRNTTGSALTKKLSGDLDAIVMKALRKEPEHRYDSAENFLVDLQRRKQNLPIIAREDTWRYNAAKFIKRHKTGLAITAGFVLLVISFAAFYTWQITEERDIAQIEAQKAEQATIFLTDLIESNYPENAQGDTITVREFLNQGYDRIQKLDQSPEVKASIMQVIAQTYRTLGELDKAGSLIDQAVGMYDTLNAQPIEKAKAYQKYGLILRDQGQFQEAEQTLDQSVTFFRQAGQTNTEEYAALLGDLAYIKRLNANYENALVLIEDALKIGEIVFENPHVKQAEFYYIKASILRMQDNYEQAKINQIRSLDMLQTLIDGPHPGIANNFNNLALIYDRQDSLNKSIAYYRKALAMNKELFGDFHPEIATNYSNLSSGFLELGNLDSAESNIKQALKISREVYDQDNPQLSLYLNDYGHILEYRQQYKKADSLYSKALQILENSYGSTHPRIIDTMHNKAKIAHLMGDLNQAERLFQKVLEVRRKHYDSPDEEIQNPLKRLVQILKEQHKTAEADSLENLFATDQ